MILLILTLIKTEVQTILFQVIFSIS